MEAVTDDRQPPRGARFRSITLEVNGRTYELTVATNSTLIDVLREQLLLTGAKRPCGTGQCAACTVLLDGRAVNACLVLAATVGGRSVTTVEGIAHGARLSVVQQAVHDVGGVQCGFCTPGMVLAATALLADTPHPSEEEIREALSGNLCRCTGYLGYVQAVKAAASRAEGSER